jgi:hypothetical protein
MPCSMDSLSRHGVCRWITANILNKQSRIVDKGWFSSLEVGYGADNGSPQHVTKRCIWPRAQLL